MVKSLDELGSLKPNYINTHLHSKVTCCQGTFWLIPKATLYLPMAISANELMWENKQQSENEGVHYQVIKNAITSNQFNYGPNFSARFPGCCVYPYVTSPRMLFSFSVLLGRS